MDYHTRLQGDDSLAKIELDKLLLNVKAPPVYGEWNYAEELAKVPVDLRLAFEALVYAVAGGVHGDVKPGITLLGKPGVGKTRSIFTLAQSLLIDHWYGEKIFRRDLQPMMIEHVEWVSAVRLSNRFGESDARTEAQSLIKDAETTPGFLFLDDVGVAGMPDFVAEAFYTLIDQRLKNWRPTILVSNATADDLAQNLDPRVSHRLLRWTKVITYPT